MMTMTPEHQVIWKKIAAFEVGAPTDPLSFCQRLARENLWSLTYAQRVFEEYKKFIFLCATGTQPMTPSDAVDQAWHLHLTYTRSYWEQLCGEVLDAPLHHAPTRGGREETDKFRCWYTRTLSAYETCFGAPPPADVWPDAHSRFAAAPYFKRLNIQDYWLLPRQRMMKGLRWLGLGGFSIAGLTACSLLDENGLWVFTLVFVLPIVGLFMLGRRARRRGRRDKDHIIWHWYLFGGGHSNDDHSDNDSGNSDSACGSSGCGGGGCGGD
jgi:hypothetical protein